MPDRERTLTETHAGADRIALIAESFTRVTGGELAAPPAPSPNALAHTTSPGDLATRLWHAPAVIVAHATEPDPVFFYANRAALNLFEMPAGEFIRLPSRFSAEPLAREERARLLAQVSARNFIADYSGVRIARSGRRFRIEQAIVWNLIAADGTIHGQAACFDRWTPIG